VSLVTVIPGRLLLKCGGTRAETRFRLSAKRTSPFKSAGASVQSTTGSRVVHISGSNAGYTMFRVSVKCTGYPLHSPVSPSLPLPCVTVCHHVSTGVYTQSLLTSISRQQVLTKRCHLRTIRCHNRKDRKLREKCEYYAFVGHDAARRGTSVPKFREILVLPSSWKTNLTRE